MTVGASPEAIRIANWGSTPKFDWGSVFKGGEKILEQAGQIYPTGKGFDIASQLGFASAEALRKQAEEIPKKAEWEITQERKFRKRLVGQQSFAFGYAGVEISLTALDVLEETKREMQMDEEMTYREGQLSKVLLLEEAKYAEEAAAAQRKAGKAAKKAGKTAETLGWVSTGLSAYAILAMSDKTLKKDIRDIVYDIDDLMSLRPVSFKWKDTGMPDLGVIAQELKEVVPELVQGEEPNMKVNYAGLVAVLIKSVQQQQERIKILEEHLCPV